MASPKNKTLLLTQEEDKHYSPKLLKLYKKTPGNAILNKIICQNIFEAAPYLPDNFVDLMILDPPYNLTKHFGSVSFKEKSIEDYSLYLDSFLSILIRTLKPNATIYICGDWKSSPSIHMIALKYFLIQNRITWQREKGRGAKSNWKNAHEDIWFCTKSKNFTLNREAVKIRKILKDPKSETPTFQDFPPSNLWNDITIPYWSMPENTEHPTQKPEKLIAKLILASSNKGDVIFDPFCGSGTACVVAKKLNRNYVAAELDHKYACISQKRIDSILSPRIQGYTNGIFWERNTLSYQKKTLKENNLNSSIFNNPASSDNIEEKIKK